MYSISINYNKLHGYETEKLSCWQKFKKIVEMRNIACIVVIKKLLLLGLFLSQLSFYGIYMNNINGLKNENEPYNFEPICNCTNNITISGNTGTIAKESTYFVTIFYTIIIAFLIIIFLSTFFLELHAFRGMRQRMGCCTILKNDDPQYDISLLLFVLFILNVVTIINTYGL
jgi:hypothetical protein